MSKSTLPVAIFMALCIGAQAGRLLKTEQIEYNHPEFNHTEIYSSLKNLTNAFHHNYTIDTPEIIVSIFNHTWNKTNAYLEELTSLFNHSSEKLNYTHTDIHQALFNYSKVHAEATEEVKYELPSFHHELPKFNHTKTNLTFVLPTFNHSSFNYSALSHDNKTGVVAQVTEEYQAFVEKHG